MGGEDIARHMKTLFNTFSGKGEQREGEYLEGIWSRFFFRIGYSRPQRNGYSVMGITS